MTDPNPAINDGLNLEVAQFNIRSSVFMPGYFVSEVMTDANRQDSDSSQHIAAYDPLRAMAAAVFARNKFGQNHRGDSPKGVKLMVDVIRGEGIAAGKKFPRRLAIGAEAVTSLEIKCKEDLRMLKEWGDVMGSTDRKDWVQVEGIEQACTPIPYDWTSGM